MEGTPKLLDSVAGDQHYSRLQEIHVSKSASYLENNNQVHSNFKPRSDALMDVVSDLISGYQCTARGRTDHSVYSGYTGIALTRFLMYKRTNNSDDLETARKLTDTALTRLTGHEVSFLTGDAGPLALGVMIYHDQGDHDRASELRLRHDSATSVNLPVVTNMMTDRREFAVCWVFRLLHLGLNPDPDIPCALINGWAGYLYALLFINKHIPSLIPAFNIKKVVQKILKAGVLRKRSTVPLNYEWKGKRYLGALYGVCGILYMLLCSGVLEESEIFTLIRPTLDDLIATRKLSVNYPPYPESSHDLVQWCHGSAGFVALFIKASEVINSSYMSNAFECATTVWRYGVLRKGYSLCHGVAGNAYAFLQLYKKTKDKKHLLKAVSFYEWCMHWPRYEAVKPDRPFSLFKGQTGLLYFLTDMRDINATAFPGYEL